MRHCVCVLATMLLTGTLIVSGCTGTKNQGATGISPVPEKQLAYGDVLESWTQESRLYDGLSTKLISKATFKTAAFRQAYATEYARLYKLEGTEYDKLVADQQKEAADYHDFVIAVYVPEKQWDDFSKDTSMWKIYMTRDNVEQIRHLEIRKLKAKDPITAYFYPYMTTWKSIYLVRFPTIDPKTGNHLTDDLHDAVTLVMTSVIGSVEFKWEYNRKQ
ncbi:MAG: hypothetical protein QNK29_15470 [Desulfobacterales bacterium]|nr:hypothetical protein [Desulfobacterales bacterium]MDX2513380.1 hypothetical protein [Desulfobacterales bacterium]